MVKKTRIQRLGEPEERDSPAAQSLTFHLQVPERLNPVGFVRHRRMATPAAGERFLS
jgi:hypothetical protein